MISYLCILLRIIGLVWPTRLIFLAIIEVLSFGFNLAMSSPSDKVGVARHVIYCCHQGLQDGVFIILLEFIPLRDAIFLNALVCCLELNMMQAGVGRCVE